MSRRATAPVERNRSPATPSHHAPDGGFRNPWPSLEASPRDRSDMLRWMWERLRNGRAPGPRPEELPRATPDLAVPRLEPDSGEARLTWVGHATFLVQLPGVNLLTDPMFGRRASPVRWLGPGRLSPPGLELDDLPPVDLVLQSHDHYDHLDAWTVDGLLERFPDVTWFAGLGHRAWYERRGAERVVELDWWQDARFQAPATGADVRLRCLPARHWSRRRFVDTCRRLWCAWGVEVSGRRVFFGGDSGYGPGFSEIGRREAPYDVALLPIGAYEPRWFMRASHMNPEEAAQACQDLGAKRMVGMHWGTFRLTDEPPLEPPSRVRRAWSALGRDPDLLHIPAFGETLSL